MLRERMGFRIMGVLVLGVLVLMLSGLAGCAKTSSNQKKVIKIGVAQPLTGPSASDGRQSLNGATLALQNAKTSMPALAAYDIQIVSEDDASDPAQAASVANKFAGDNQVLAVIGNYNSSCTLAGAPILTKAGIPQIATGSSAPKITGYSKYLFRTQPTDNLMAAQLAKWATELGYKKAAILYENTDYGAGLEQLYKSSWTGEGQSVVLDDSYLADTMDYTPILASVKSSGADVVLLGSLYNEAALMGKQANAIGLKVAFFGDSSLSTNAIFDLGNEGVEGLRCVSNLDPKSTDPAIVNFFQQFKQQYNNDPNVFAAQSYDAMNLVLTSLAQNGPDRAKLQDYLATVKDFPGITGKLSFTNGDVYANFYRFIAKDGQFVSVQS